MLFAEGQVFLGNDLLAWLVLALGGALFAGNIAALGRPPDQRHRPASDLPQAPMARSIAMAVVGFIAAAWALASLIS